MAASLQYNFPNDSFTIYKPLERVEVNLPLFENPIDISDWSTGISSSGTPIVKNNISTRKLDNPQEYTYQNTTNENNTQQQETKQNPNLKNKEKRAMDFFESKGLKSHQAAGIVGNFMHESSLNEQALGDNGTSYGLGQWHNSRWDQLKKYAKNKGKDYSDFDIQLEFAWNELENNPKLLSMLKNSKNSNEATDLILDIYERPKYPNQSRSQRRKNAERLLS